jgi:uncharacterized repeat protein (TIGR01451 family)
MASQRNGRWLNWLPGIGSRGPRGQRRKNRSGLRHGLGRFEPLEARTLLAGDFAAIAGLVTVNVGGVDESVAGVVMDLHRDNGDGVFNPAVDVLVSSAVTAAGGRYRFDTLSAGGYFVHQDAFAMGSGILPAAVSSLITITPAEAEGTMHTVIDSFDTTLQVARANSGSPYAASTVAASEAIGGFRKLVATLDQPFGTVTLAANDPDSGPARLDFSATATATGSRRVTWDGSGGAAAITNFVGLGGIDLTEGGLNSGITMLINADKAGSVTLRLFTDADNSSAASIPFPDTLGGVTAVFLPFSSLAATAGAGANLTSIGAIQIDISAASAAADGFIAELGGFGATVETVNFTNQPIDLSVTKGVDDTTPDVGDDVTFTVVVSNTGVIDATGVAVRDVLPTGLAFVGAVATQGTYDAGSGLWQVGTVAATGSQTLTVTATVTTPGTKTNAAEVWTANEFDVDSTPGNGNPSEDDMASVALTPTLIDLEVTKIVNTPAPLISSSVTFTITVGNMGPDVATGVTVVDVLPAGLVYQSSTASTGTYDAVTGLWAVGTLANSQVETLSVTASVTTPGTKVNTAQVWTANEFDSDSTPGNDAPTEDDQASAQVVPVVPPPVVLPSDPPPPPPPPPPVVLPGPLPTPTPGRFNKLRFLAR